MSIGSLVTVISLYSYIKPQPYRAFTIPYLVVYLYIPTSNHNGSFTISAKSMLYIFIFLHQTTTSQTKQQDLQSCISLYSYIKPQLRRLNNKICRVVYLYIPTSNHNPGILNKHTNMVVYLYIPTSNHNGEATELFPVKVVYLYIPTSNHNSKGFRQSTDELYIFIFLHQTTTNSRVNLRSSSLYIFIFLHQTTTAGLNAKLGDVLYIFIFLHQTTT